MCIFNRNLIISLALFLSKKIGLHAIVMRILREFIFFVFIALKLIRK